MSRQAEEIFSRKRSIEITEKPRFMKGLSQKGESSSSNGLCDKDSEPELRETMEYIHLTRGHLARSVANCMEKSV